MNVPIRVQISFTCYQVPQTKPWISFKVVHEPLGHDLVKCSDCSSHLYVLVAGISEQWVGQPSAVFPPTGEEIQHHSTEARRPLLQKHLPHRLQKPQHQLQDAAVLHVRQQECMHILALWRTTKNREKNKKDAERNKTTNKTKTSDSVPDSIEMIYSEELDPEPRFNWESGLTSQLESMLLRLSSSSSSSNFFSLKIKKLKSKPFKYVFTF